MFRTIWSQERYKSEYNRYVASQDETLHTSMISSMSWHKNTLSLFHDHLNAQGIGWEKDVNDNYIKMRNTSAFQSFIQTNPASISMSLFYNLLLNIINEAYGDLSYLDDGFPKLLNGTIDYKKRTLISILKDYGISINIL